MKNVKYLHNIHKGETIYIIGSGKSMEFINPEFFRDKITIGLNFTYRDFPIKYAMSHHHFVVKKMISTGLTVITSEHDTCFFAKPIHSFDGIYYYYKHKEQGYTQIDLNVFDDPEYLVAAGSITTTALHCAYRMGASTIIACGIDGGTIDGQMNYAAYCNPTNRDHPSNVTGQIKKMVDAIRNRGTEVYSLNPWINFSLEGHTWEP